MFSTIGIGLDAGAGGADEDRFDVLAEGALDEPVRRYFSHAIAHGAWRVPGVELAMRGRVRVGMWLPFSARQTSDGASFTWRARVPGWHLPVLEVVDRLGPDGAATSGRLLARVGVFEQSGPDVLRSAAGRAGLEGIFSPLGLLPEHGVTWRVEDDDVVSYTRVIGPEEPTVHLRLAPDGAVREAWALRWGDAGDGSFAYLPCGCEVLAERRFGPLVLPSAVRVSWGFGTPAQRPFFQARILRAAQGRARSGSNALGSPSR